MAPISKKSVNSLSFRLTACTTVNTYHPNKVFFSFFSPVHLRKCFKKFVCKMCAVPTKSDQFGQSMIVFLPSSHEPWTLWMRSSRVVRPSGCQCQSLNSPAVPASSDTVEAGEAITYIKRKKKKNPPLKNHEPKIWLFPSPHQLKH
jgi:hypothetical protein